jgi:hypothetical protein
MTIDKLFIILNIIEIEKMKVASKRNAFDSWEIL